MSNQPEVKNVLDEKCSVVKINRVDIINVLVAWNLALPATAFIAKKLSCEPTKTTVYWLSWLTFSVMLKLFHTLQL